MQIVASIPSITSAAALAATQAAVAHGRSIGKSVVAAVVDVGGDLMACLRADGAYAASIGIARDKAYTAAVFGVATDELGRALSGNEILREGIALRPGVILFGRGAADCGRWRSRRSGRGFGRLRGRRPGLRQGRACRSRNLIRGKIRK